MKLDIKGILSFIKITERHAAQAPALRERHPQIFNHQYSIVNSTLTGLDLSKKHLLNRLNL